jgi:hypothetical protein
VTKQTATPKQLNYIYPKPFSGDKNWKQHTTIIWQKRRLFYVNEKLDGNGN